MARNHHREAPRDEETPTYRWLESGDEVCEHCLGTYVHEVELRCAICDGPLCPLCALRVRGAVEVLCPECVEPRVDERET